MVVVATLSKGSGAIARPGARFLAEVKRSALRGDAELTERLSELYRRYLRRSATDAVRQARWVTNQNSR